MLKREFLEALSSGLSGLDEAGRNERLQFYSDMIDDRMEEGLGEEDAVGQIGAPDAVAEQILSDMPLSKLIRGRIGPKRSIPAWEIVLLVLGAPIWLSLLIAALAALFSLYAAVWAVIIALYATDLALAACAVAGVVALVIGLMAGQLPTALCALGAGLACAGLAVLLFFANAAISKALLRLSRRAFGGIKKRIGRRNPK